MERDLRKEIIKTVKECLNTPYLWGGDSKEGFDCSGLLKYIYSQNNINIPRTTYEQVRIGRVVDKNNLKKGDLLFFGNNSLEPYHVGIYIGDNKYIHASKTGYVVKISDLKDRDDFLIAKRIINDNNEIIIMSNNTKHFIGDPKYTLYQYVYDMNSNNITFRCGKYAYNKITKMSGFNGSDFCGNLNLNGENIVVVNMEKLSKKQLIISKEYKYIDDTNITIYLDDIVLEFA